MPRRLQDKIHSEKRMDLEKYYEIDEESSIAGFEIWSGYGEQIFNSLLSGSSEQDFDNHLIREYNLKMERMSATPYFFTPYDAGYRFAGLDPDAKAYIEEIQDAGASTNFIQKNAVNNFCHKAKQDGSWNKISRLFLPIWQNEAANKICLKTLNTGAFLGGTRFHEKGHVRFTGGSNGAYFDAGASLSGTISNTSGAFSIFHINRQFNINAFMYLYGAHHGFLGGGRIYNYYYDSSKSQNIVFNSNVFSTKSLNNLGLTTYIRPLTNQGFLLQQNDNQSESKAKNLRRFNLNDAMPSSNLYFGTVNYLDNPHPNRFSGSFGAFGWGEPMNLPEALKFNSNLIELWKGCNDQDNIVISSSTPAFLPYERAYIHSQIESGDYFYMGLQTTTDYAKTIWWDNSSTIDSATDYSNINFSKQKTSEDLISVISIYPSDDEGEDVEDSHITHIKLSSPTNKVMLVDFSKLSQLEFVDLSQNENLSQSILDTENFHPNALNTLTGIDLSYCDFYDLDFALFTGLHYLNVSNNTNLTNISASGLALNSNENNLSFCNLDDQALNYFFSGLAPTQVSGVLIVNDNPGSLTCDIPIATGKGYIVIVE
jgi:hypothetical protein